MIQPSVHGRGTPVLPAVSVEMFSASIPPGTHSPQESRCMWSRPEYPQTLADQQPGDYQGNSVKAYTNYNHVVCILNENNIPA